MKKKTLSLVGGVLIFSITMNAYAGCTAEQIEKNMLIWGRSINQHNVNALNNFYPENSIFIGPHSSKLLRTSEERERYYNKLFADNNSSVNIKINHHDVVHYNHGTAIGHITFNSSWIKQGKQQKAFERSVFVYNENSNGECRLILQDVSAADTIYD